MGVAQRCGSCLAMEATTLANGQKLQLPLGWISLTVEPGGVREDFCSADCAATWMMELGELADALEQADPEKFGRPASEWEPAVWAAFCRQHRVTQADALQHAQAEARKAGEKVSRWVDVARLPEIADSARRFVLAHSRTLTATPA